MYVRTRVLLGKNRIPWPFFFLKTFSYIPTVPQVTALTKVRTRTRWSILAYMLAVSDIGNTLLHLLN